MSLFVPTSLFAGKNAAMRDEREAPQRVVIATLERTEGDTGIHTHTRTLMDGLKRAGVECELSNPFSAGPKWLPLFAVRRLVLRPVNKTWGLRWYRHWHYAALRESLTRNLLRRPADAIVAQCPVSARAALDARRRLKLSCPITMVCHFNFSEAAEYREQGELKNDVIYNRMMKLEGLILRSVDRVIYVSDWSRRVVETERGIRPRKSCVIRNGIVMQIDSSKLRREDIGLAKDDLVLMNVGSLEPRKNQLALLDLFSLLRAKFPAAKLVLIGDGAQRDDIEAKIRRDNLGGSVILLGHRTDVPALLPLADMYVHYSKLENCPIALLEAARADLPTAAIHAGGITEMSAPLGGILSLDETDLGQSLAALSPLLSDAQLRRSLGQQARSGFESHFTQDAMVQAYLDALHLNAVEVRP